MPTLAPAARAAAWLIAALLLMALTARLGLWQLDRAARKMQLQQTILSRMQEPPLPAVQLAREPMDVAAQEYRRIQIKGRWLDRFTVFLDNRQMGGRPGFFVVTPLLLAPQDGVLVQRGWVPRDPAERTHLPDLPLPDGEVTVSARVAPPPSRLFEFASGEGGSIRQNLDPVSYAHEIGLTLRPVSLQQLAGAEGSDPRDGLLREWPLPATDVGKHHGYALQWFAFSAMTAGLYVWFQLLRPRFAGKRH